MKASSTSGHRFAVIGAGALAATLALSGCGVQQPDAAAVVDDTTITEEQVDSVMNDTAGADLGGTTLTRQGVLQSLMLAPFVSSYLSSKGKAVSADQAMKQVLPTVKNASAATKEWAAFQLGAGNLAEADGTAVLANVAKAKITVNPRYGVFDMTTGLHSATPNWIVNPTATESAAVAPGATEEPTAGATEGPATQPTATGTAP